MKLELKLERDIFSDEEIDRINEATYELNSVARKLLYIRLGLPVRDGVLLRDKIRNVRRLLSDI